MNSKLCVLYEILCLYLTYVGVSKIVTE